MSKLLNALSFKHKILGNSALLLLLLVMCSGYSLYALKAVGVELSNISELDFPISLKLTAVTEAQLKQARHLERALRFGGLSAFDPDAAKTLQQEIKQFGQVNLEMVEFLDQLDEMIVLAIPLAHNQQELDAFKHVAQELKQVREERSEVAQLADQAFQLITSGEYRKSLEVAARIGPKENQVEQRLLELQHGIEQLTRNAAQTARKMEQQAVMVLLVLALLSIALGVLIAWAIASNLVRRLSQAMKHLEYVAAGDLTREVIIDGVDEVGRCQKSILSMQQNLTDLLGAVSAKTEQLATTSEQVSATMLQTAVNIQDQQKETEQVSLSMNEMSEAVAEVSHSASDTAVATNQANNEARNGRGLVETTVGSAQQLALQVEETSREISELERDSQNIYAVLDVIKSVAEQTNLLALNAAIEAARAGEQGRGFAVVADEVRTLAGRTQDSTEEINQIIEKLQSGTQRATLAMQRSSEQTSTVVESTIQAGSSLNTITDSVARIDEKSGHIASIAQQQNRVANDMSENVAHINEVAMHNAASIEQTTVAGQEIAKIAEELAEYMSRFRFK